MKQLFVILALIAPPAAALACVPAKPFRVTNSSLYSPQAWRTVLLPGRLQSKTHFGTKRFWSHGATLPAASYCFCSLLTWDVSRRQVRSSWMPKCGR